MFVLMHLLVMGGAFTTTCELNSSRHTPCAAESQVEPATNDLPKFSTWDESKAYRAAEKKQAEHP